MSDSTEFAKIFHVNGRQVLVFVEEGEEKDYDVHQMARTSFGMVDSKISLNVKDTAPDDYDAITDIISRFDQSEAEKFILSVEKLESSFSEAAA